MLCAVDCKTSRVLVLAIQRRRKSQQIATATLGAHVKTLTLGDRPVKPRHRRRREQTSVVISSGRSCWHWQVPLFHTHSGPGLHTRSTPCSPPARCRAPRADRMPPLPLVIQAGRVRTLLRPRRATKTGLTAEHHSLRSPLGVRARASRGATFMIASPFPVRTTEGPYSAPRQQYHYRLNRLPLTLHQGWRL